MMTTPFMTSAVCQSFEVLPQLSLAIFSVQSDVYRKKGGTWNREMDEAIEAVSGQKLMLDLRKANE